MRVFFKIVFAFVSLFATPSFAADSIRCNANGTQIELNACARDEFDKADKELNQVYQQLIKKEAKDALFISKLRNAQKAWIGFRDAELEARFACAEKAPNHCWGSMYPMSYFYRKAELTRDRTRQLQQMLKEGYGQ